MQDENHYSCLTDKVTDDRFNRIIPPLSMKILLIIGTLVVSIQGDRCTY